MTKEIAPETDSEVGEQVLCVNMYLVHWSLYGYV